MCVVVAGHICLDLIPSFLNGEAGGVLQPGSLTAIGAASMSTGGAVANTGLALHRLGIETELIGKVGDDLFGHAIRDRLCAVSPSLASGMVVAAGETTSYTVVLNPPGIDRIFLHCPGANDTFRADDITDDALHGRNLLHFGYPPLMKRFYENDGSELVRLFSHAKGHGMTTSLDLARPDPVSPAGHVDWAVILRACLPYVDVFTPSRDELLFMLDRSRFEAFEAGQLDKEETNCALSRLMDNCLDWGAAVVLLKCGDDGCLLRTTHKTARLDTAGHALAGRTQWLGVDLASPCYRVKVAGTTGAGDTTIAGFLAGLLRDLTPAEVLDVAIAAGAFCVEQPDATTGIPSWDGLMRRIDAGWRKYPADTA